MSVSDNMDFLQSAYRTCFVIAAAALILAAALFFLLDIREIFMIETGRARRKSIQEMENRNLRGGSLRRDRYSGGKSRNGESDGIFCPGQSVKGTEQETDLERMDFNSVRTGDTEELPPERTGGCGAAVCAGSGTRKISGFRIVQKTIIVHTDETIPV